MIDIDDIKKRHLDPERNRGRTYYEGHIEVDLAALIAEVERLRAERHLDNVDLAQAYDFARNKGETLEREAVVTWLRAQVSQAVSDGDLNLDWAAERIERGEHRREEKP
jgi:hypothetical protein